MAGAQPLLDPRLHSRISMLTIVVLLPLSWYCWAGWLLWAVLLRMIGGRYSDVPLHPPLNKTRWWLGAFAVLDAHPDDYSLAA